MNFLGRFTTNTEGLINSLQQFELGSDDENKSFSPRLSHYQTTIINVALSHLDEENFEVSKNDQELILKSHSTILSIIDEIQPKLQEILEKICMITSLDLLCQLADTFKNVKKDILSLKRYVNIINF